MIEFIENAIVDLERINPNGYTSGFGKRRNHRLRKVLVANRGEIAKRFFLALREEGIPSVAIVTDADKNQSWVDAADEVVYIGESSAYINIPRVIAAALRTDSNAIYPGYGFLSENPDFTKAITLASRHFERDLIFMGPSTSVMKKAGNKLDARRLAETHNVPIFVGSPKLNGDNSLATKEAARIGYPVIMKLDAGGGGKGMAIAYNETELINGIDSIRRVGQANYENDDFYLERYIEKPVHFEVQIFNGSSVGIRKCAVQRRNQKVIEESGEAFLTEEMSTLLLKSAEYMAEASGYSDGGGAGTVEFLYDAEQKTFGFLEMNTRLQVEYAVTDASLGIDLVKWQIWQFDGRSEKIPFHTVGLARKRIREHAIQCRVYAEDSFHNYSPSPGKIIELALPSFNGVRCDFGFQAGDEVVSDYDPMIGKLIVSAATRDEAIVRLQRALSELYISGVTTNTDQLLRIVDHPNFRQGDYTNRLLDTYKELTDITDSSEFKVEAGIFASILKYEQTKYTQISKMSLGRGVQNEVIATSFDIKCAGENFRVEILPVQANQFILRIDERYAGTLEIANRLEDGLPNRILYGGRYFVIRLDSRGTNTMILRISETHGKVNYYRAQVTPLDGNQKPDPAGLVRCPFRSNFVKFGQIGENTVALGSQVKEGDEIITISAMKMETVIRAPFNGSLTQIIENGDASLLILGYTPAGLVRGRSLPEGQPLFTVEPELNSEVRDTTAIESSFVSHNFIDHIKGDQGLKYFKKSFSKSFSSSLNILEAALLGFYNDAEGIANIAKLICETQSELSELPDSKQITQKMILLLSIYWKSERAFLNNRAKPDLTIRSKSTRWQPLAAFYSQSELNDDEFTYFVRCGNRNAQILTSFIPQFCSALASLGKLPMLGMTVNRLIQVEELAGREDSVIVLRGMLKKLFPGGLRNREGYTNFPRKFSNVFRYFSRNPLSVLNVNEEEFTRKAKEALANPQTTIEAPYLSEKTQAEFYAKIQFLKNRYEILMLPTDSKGILFFSLILKEKPDHKEFLCFAYPHEGRVMLSKDSQGRITGAPNVENALIRSAALFAFYNNLTGSRSSRLEILADERPSHIDLTGNDPDLWNYKSLRQLGHTVIPFFLDLDLKQLTMDLGVMVSAGVSQRKQVSFYMKKGRIHLGLLLPEDPLHPYYQGQGDSKNDRLFQRNKWPVEFWARECLDSGTLQELRISSIDTSPVGARLYSGDISGRPALLFMKDSRIAGGATGDLEGRKYIASCYLAYMTNRPLYVWNDGAGANIKQGMISLNRAAQGFMMNALVSEAVTYEKFNAYTAGCEDSVILDLFKELDEQFSLKKPNFNYRPNNVFLTAVGIGSSTGLDVYGSSQLSIQVMIDSNQSYRVLTGSNVIKSVTGEDLTNYELGGAGAMGRHTGTVDVIAYDKIDLLCEIRKIHEMFSRCEALQREKDNSKKAVNNPIEDKSSLFQARMSESKIFLPMKSEYIGAESLTGGFIRLAENPVLVLSTEQKDGCSSLPVWLKARELLQMARKTRSPRILQYANKLLDDQLPNAKILRAKLDFFDELKDSNQLTFHIITSAEGLSQVHGAMDIVVYVKPIESKDQSYRFITPFVSSTVEEAYSLIRKILKLMDSNALSGDRSQIIWQAPSRKVQIPSDASKPFDIHSDVIEGIVDSNSFVEMYADWYDSSSGPNLVTGIASLEGTTIGIIADQPQAGSAPDAIGTEKFRVFTQFLQSRNIPLLMLSNAAGFTPGAKQEQLRIQQVGAFSLDVNILSTIPIASVVLKQNYGGRQIHAFSKFLRPGIKYITLRNSILAVMGASAAFDLFKAKEHADLIAGNDTESARKLYDSFVSEFNQKARADVDAEHTGLVDVLVDNPNDLRQVLSDLFR